MKLLENLTSNHTSVMHNMIQENSEPYIDQILNHFNKSFASVYPCLANNFINTGDPIK